LSEIEQRIKNKIEAIGTPLEEWGISINYGIKTGYNEAFIINGHKKDELISKDPKSAELIRPILRGRDIKRYSYTFSDLYLIATHNGNQKQGMLPVNIDNYTAIKRHLNDYYEKILTRADQGNTPYNLRNCAYWDDFFKPKIIYPETTQGAYFYLDKSKHFIDKTCFMMISKCPEYLLANLASKLYEYAYKKIFSSIELGINGYQYNKHALVKLPIITLDKVDKEILIKIEKHVDDLLQESSQKRKGQIYRELDEMIYRLYKIDEEEIRYIQSNII